MPFEIFLIPGLLFFAYGFYKSKKYFEQQQELKEENNY